MFKKLRLKYYDASGAELALPAEPDAGWDQLLTRFAAPLERRRGDQAIPDGLYQALAQYDYGLLFSPSGATVGDIISVGPVGLSEAVGDGFAIGSAVLTQEELIVWWSPGRGRLIQVFVGPHESVESWRPLPRTHRTEVTWSAAALLVDDRPQIRAFRRMLVSGEFGRNPLDNSWSMSLVGSIRALYMTRSIPQRW